MARFPLLGEPLALDLANTIVREHGELRDLLAEPGGVEAWLDAHADRLPDGPVDGGGLLDLRDAVVELLRARDGRRAPASHAVATLTAVLEGAVPRVVAGKTGPEVRFGAGEAQALALISYSALVLLADDRNGVRACANPDCVLHFAVSDARRRFCVARTCGNRARQARHRNRRRTVEP